MNKIYKLIAIFLIISQGIFAQTFPETFNYQAVARNDDGTPIANKEIVVEVTILQGTDCDNGSNCNIAWQELHYPTTNDFGLFSINIGEGQNTFAGSETVFSNISWNDFTSGNYFLKMRVDFGSSGYGNGLIDMGVVEFQSVPYCFSAEKSIDIERTGGKVPFNLTELLDVDLTSLTSSQVLSWNGTNWVNVDASSGGAVSLSDLTDVSLGSPTTYEVLSFNGTNWTDTTLTVNQLGDVSVTAAANGELFKYNGTNWANSTISTADLTDLTITAPTVGQSIFWNGTNWENQDVAVGSSVWTEDASYVFYNGGKNIGIGTATPTELFQISLINDEGILIDGAYSAASVPNLGASTRMSFYPGKSAFRVGSVDGTQWDNANTGAFSIAAGRNNIAFGQYSSVFGYDNEANGTASFVTGSSNIAIGLNSIVYGSNNNATSGIDGDNSIVGGSGNDGFSEQSLTVGLNNDNYGNNSIVFGELCRTGGNSVSSIAGGNTTIVNGSYAFGIGLGVTANAYASLVIGRYNVLGGNNLTWSATDPALVIGNGTDASNRHNAVVIHKNGNMEIQGTLTQSVANPTKSVKITNYDNIFKIDGIFDQNTNSFGLNPNQIETYFPNLVTDFNDGKAINYSGFVPLIIETVKAQQKTIENLKTENENLKAQLDNIEIRLQELEN